MSDFKNKVLFKLLFETQIRNSNIFIRKQKKSDSYDLLLKFIQRLLLIY